MSDTFWYRVNDLEECAGKASPGVWIAKIIHTKHKADLYITSIDREENDRVEIFNVPYADGDCDLAQEQRDNAAYVLAAHPAIIKEMIAELYRLKEDNKTLAQAAAASAKYCTKLDHQVDWLADVCAQFIQIHENAYGTQEYWRERARRGVHENKNYWGNPIEEKK